MLTPQAGALTHMLPVDAAAAEAHDEKQSAELKKVELPDRTKELDRQASKVGPHAVA